MSQPYLPLTKRPCARSTLHSGRARVLKQAPAASRQVSWPYALTPYYSALGGTVRPLNLEPGCFADRSRVRARGRYCLQRFVNFRFSRNDRRLTSPAVWCPSSPRSFSLCFLSSVRFLALHCLIIANLQLAILLCWMMGDAPSRLRFPLL